MAATTWPSHSPEARIHALPSAKRVSSFTPLLAAYHEAGIQLYSAIDGGAGAGATAKQMLPYLNGVVFAFEPFPGNHRFFANRDPRITLIPKALAETPKAMAFRVSSVVTSDSTWGQRGMEGYSSVGRLVTDPQAGDLTVQCVRADAEIPPGHDISFIKLDLQGGELDALKGMAGLLSKVLLMWVEFTGQSDLLDYLIDQDFMIFDTEYMFLGEPSDEAQGIFEVSKKNVTLSTGKSAWNGFRRATWKSYEGQFQQYRTELSLIQTDLVCVNRARFDEFERALSFL